jgi:hypothetical protein
LVPPLDITDEKRQVVARVKRWLWSYALRDRGRESFLASIRCWPPGRGVSRKTPPFIAVPRADAGDAKWAEPKIVCEVEFSQWTRDGRVRQSAFAGAIGARARRKATEWGLSEI